MVIYILLCKKSGRLVKPAVKQISPSFRIPLLSYLQLMFWVGFGFWFFFKETINRAQQFVSLIFLRCELSQLLTTYLSLCRDLFLMRFLLYVCLEAAETHCQETNCLRMKGFTKLFL